MFKCKYIFTYKAYVGYISHFLYVFPYVELKTLLLFSVFLDVLEFSTYFNHISYISIFHTKTVHITRIFNKIKQNAISFRNIHTNQNYQNENYQTSQQL